MMALSRIVRLVLLVSLIFVSSVHALEVEDASITTQIVKRAPIDSLNTVPADVDKLYCFTRITGATEDTWVTHVWYCEDKELTRVRLPVNSLNWRTWSSKRVLPQWKGAWRVEVLNNEGQTLLIIPFSIF